MAPHVCFGASFRVSSNVGEWLQIAIVIDRPVHNTVSDSRYVHLETIRNGTTINYWRQIKRTGLDFKGKWGYQFFLIAIDKDIVKRRSKLRDVRNQIPLLEFALNLIPENEVTNRRGMLQVKEEHLSALCRPNFG